MRFRFSTRYRRRLSYSSRMWAMSPSPLRMASMAAYWLVVGADMIPNWWSLVMAATMGLGAHT